jgi:predicted esterase
VPRVAIAYGSADDVVPIATARSVRTLLEHAGAEVLSPETAVGHERDRTVIPALRALLADVPGAPHG